MNIYVLLKQTFDTEEKVLLDGDRISDDGVKFVINPYDEYAVEEALLQRDAHGGKVIVVGAGPDRTTEAMRTALAMGADEAVLIFLDEEEDTDEYSAAALLAAYLKDQEVDLILGGNFSVDTGGGQVAVRLATLLGLPHVSSISSLSIDGDVATVERDAEGDTETVEVTLPALFTAQQGLNEPRYPSLPGIMKAKKKPFEEIEPDDLDVDFAARTTLVSVSLPAERAAGRILTGELNEQTAELVNLLKTVEKVV
jgi:electron transfer flavoprotein beta subunit